MIDESHDVIPALKVQLFDFFAKDDVWKDQKWVGPGETFLYYRDSGQGPYLCPHCFDHHTAHVFWSKWLSGHFRWCMKCGRVFGIASDKVPRPCPREGMSRW